MWDWRKSQSQKQKSWMLLAFWSRCYFLEVGNTKNTTKKKTTVGFWLFDPITLIPLVLTTLASWLGSSWITFQTSITLSLLTCLITCLIFLTGSTRPLPLLSSYHHIFLQLTLSSFSRSLLFLDLPSVTFRHSLLNQNASFTMNRSCFHFSCPICCHMLFSLFLLPLFSWTTTPPLYSLYLKFREMFFLPQSLPTIRLACEFWSFQGSITGKPSLFTSETCNLGNRPSTPKKSDVSKEDLRKNKAS